jgi:FkbM family methyltransferase
MDPLVALLLPERLTTVVDIGASPLGDPPPYRPLLQNRLCRVIGFEPHGAALAELNKTKSDLEIYLPYAVGDGRPATLRMSSFPGLTSLLELDPDTLSAFPSFVQPGQLTREVPLTTRRLDDIAEIEHIDLLKIDVQGSELAVFQGGRQLLSQAVAIHTEVSFVPLYKGQPAFADVDIELRSNGFIPHAFAHLSRALIGPMQTADTNYAINQLVDADMVYVRDFRRGDSMGTEQLKHLAIVAHYCYRSYDLALNCIAQLMKRGVAEKSVGNQYLGMVNAAAARRI